MDESLTEQCRVKVEGLRVMNFFSRRRSNDVETTKLEYGRSRGNFRCGVGKCVEIEQNINGKSTLLD
ncbi:hypothetical protein D0Y65_000377 [Glycine soja]|uniref:Uncharacterized protein n=1 Tax=Glycine soja TaxID=3848 RepID=A0A445LYI4_GLYSO|nr:hypothetical protein D0Y65_000377 [Glycine soja]